MSVPSSTDCKPQLAIAEPIPPPSPKHRRVLIAPACALALWLGIGVFLTWLLADFSHTLGNARWLPWTVFFLFFSSGLSTAWVYWQAYRRTCRQAGEQPKSRFKFALL